MSCLSKRNITMLFCLTLSLGADSPKGVGMRSVWTGVGRGGMEVEAEIVNPPAF